MIERIKEFFTTFFIGKSRQMIEWSASIQIVLIGLLDWITGFEISFAIFYLSPICMLSWFIGPREGYYAALVSMIVIITGDIASGATAHKPFVYFWNDAVTLSFYMIVVAIVVNLKARLVKEWALSRTDPLTGIANPRHFMEQAELSLALSKRYAHPITIVYIDCDDFKQINDRMGHMKGDELLRDVAQTIREHVRLTDTVARLGGDEFAILCPETGPAINQHHIGRIRQSLTESMRKNRWPVTFSIGVATYTRLPESVDEMIRNADDLMYAVKRRGKNGIRSKIFR